MRIKSNSFENRTGHEKGHDYITLNSNSLCYPISCKGMDDKNAAKLNELIQAG